jgi:hypothetical protein
VPEELVVVLDLPADEGPETVVALKRHSTHLSQPHARHARETQSWQRSGGHAVKEIKAPLRRATA